MTASGDDAEKQKQLKERRKKARHLTERLAVLFNMIEGNPPFQNQRRIVLSMPVLYHACISYELDLERWAPFHCITIPDNHKRAAFLFKWLSKLRPIKLLSGQHIAATPWELQANGYFAIAAALGELRVNMYKFAESPEAKAMLYTSTYRDILPESWAITFCLLEKAYPAIKAA